MFRKKMCGPLTWGGRPYFSWEKNWRPFYCHHCQLSVLQRHLYLLSPEKLATLFVVITVAFIHFTRVSPIISGMLLCYKKCSSFCGGLFCGGALLFSRTCWRCLNSPLVTKLTISDCFILRVKQSTAFWGRRLKGQLFKRKSVPAPPPYRSFLRLIQLIFLSSQTDPADARLMRSKHFRTRPLKVSPAE